MRGSISVNGFSGVSLWYLSSTAAKAVRISSSVFDTPCRPSTGRNQSRIPVSKSISVPTTSNVSVLKSPNFVAPPRASIVTLRTRPFSCRLPERSYVRHPREGAGVAVPLVGLTVGLRVDAWWDGGSTGGLGKAVETEEAYIVARYAGVCEVGHDLANHARELVAVPRARRGERDLLVVWVHVDDEVVVRRVGEHAGLQVHRRPAPVGEVALGEVPQHPLVAVVGLAVVVVGVDDLFEVVVLAELETGDTVNREAVETSLVHEQVEDGELFRAEALGAGRLEPGEDLALGGGEAVEDVEELAVPGAGGHDELLRLVGAAVRADAHAVLARFPVEDSFVAVDLGARGLRGLNVGDDAPLGREEAAVGLKEGEVLGRQVVAGVAAPELGAGQD